MHLDSFPWSAGELRVNLAGVVGGGRLSCQTRQKRIHRRVLNRPVTSLAVAVTSKGPAGRCWYGDFGHVWKFRWEAPGLVRSLGVIVVYLVFLSAVVGLKPIRPAQSIAWL